MAADYRADAREFNKRLVAEFRANQGVIRSGPLAGSRLLILTTKGARSGEIRETPLGFVTDGPNHAVIALNLGAPSHPAWFHNLVVNPEVEFEVPGQKHRAMARLAEGDEHERLHAAFGQRITDLAGYEGKTSRKIPIVVLEPKS